MTGSARRMRDVLWLAGMVAAFAGGATAAAGKPAELAYRNGVVYTADAADTRAQAVAVSGGRIVYVGDDAGLAPLIGPDTRVVDLQGRMVMPGLIDGHLHPLEGGAVLLKCSLEYERLTVAAMQARIQVCLDKTRSSEPDGWLEVVSWFQEAMLPAGVVTDRSVLDGLKTTRPIVVISSFGHTALVNTRALALAHIDASTPDPIGGRIAHDASGVPTGLLEDAAYGAVTRQLPAPTAADDLRSARAALDALRRQGVTSFLDASTQESDLAAFAAVERDGGLTARAHFAMLLTPDQGTRPEAAVAAISRLARRYGRPGRDPAPQVTVRNVKLFLDGVITAPACTGAMLQPYFVPGESGAPWHPGNNRGPDVYFPAATLARVLSDLAGAGFDPHLHADGDRAVHEALDGIEAMRKSHPNKDIRPAIAHDEIVDPADYARYQRLNAIPVLSMQWEKPAPDTVDGARDYLGPVRYPRIEPAGLLHAAGARIAFGSDWPVDALDEWFALKVGVTRTNGPEAAAQYPGRLGEDPGLSRETALRAATIDAAYELHEDQVTGSLEVGKLADLIVLDRNFFQIPAEQIASIKVVQTVVGGRIVYESK